jgi:hypothetical protein
MVIGRDSVEFYDKWILKPETALGIGVSFDSVCSVFGLPRIFETTEKDREYLRSLKRKQKESRVKRYESSDSSAGEPS